MFGRRRNYKPGFVDKMVERIVAGQPLRVADDRIDSPTYALDVARRLVSMLKDKIPSGLYHLTNAGTASYYELVRTLVEYMGSDLDVQRAKDSDFPSPGYKALRIPLENRKLAPLRSWKDALRDYVDTELKA